MLTHHEFLAAVAELQAKMQGEPVFVLRGRDPTMPGLVARWALSYLNRKRGLGQMNSRDQHKYGDAIAQSESARMWQIRQERNKHPGPDCSCHECAAVQPNGDPL